MAEQTHKDKKRQTRQRLLERRKESKKLEALVAIECSHQKDNGDLDVDYLDPDTDIVRCRTCDEIFDMGLLEQKEIKKAFNTLNSAVQQIRAMSSSSEEDQENVEDLGRLAYAMEQIPKQYKDTLDAFSGRKRKKRNGKGGGKKGKKNNVEWQRDLNGLFNQKKKKK